MSVPPPSVRRWEPYAGLVYVLSFVASVVVSNPPADNASDRTWTARYTGHGEQAGHLATGLLLMTSGLALMTFLVALWRRIAELHPAEPSRLPIAAAASAAALMGAGGMVMAYISGGEIFGSYPLPSPDLLRMSNDLGFALAGVAGSWAAAVAVATLSVQGHSVGIFGSKMRAAGIVTAIALLLSMLFAPILALLAWVLAAAFSWIRNPELNTASPTPTPASL
jgi:MFS family permease